MTRRFNLGDEIHRMVTEEFGGYLNFHTHFDRAGTLGPQYLSHFGMTPLEATRASLRVKQSLTGELHKGVAYTPDSLRARMRECLKRSIDCNVRKVISFIDTTPDIGVRALEIARNLGEEFDKEIDFELIPHPIFGFKDDDAHEISRWELFKSACAWKSVAAVGALPERDDRGDSVGSDEHFRRVLRLGNELKKPVHIHVGQANTPDQNDIFDLIEAVRWIGAPEISDADEPAVWAVHNISASALDEDRFAHVLWGQREHNIGTVCCPRAAVSMRQSRAHNTPVHNSVARVLDMALVGIPIRIGTDNIADMFIPTGTESVLEEVLVLADAVRFYDPRVLAKFAAGRVLNDSDREVIRHHLEQDERANRDVDPNFNLAALRLAE